MRRGLTRIAIGVAMLLAGCGDDAGTPLTIGTNVWPGYEPFYLAQASGLLPGKDVPLIQYPSASEVIRGFANGAISAAAVTLDEALLMSARGLPVKIVLVIDASQGGDAILGQRGLSRIEDLAGRKVGAETSALGAFMLCRAAETHGLDCRRDFTTVNLEASEHEQAFTAGTIDAVVTFEPTRTHLVAQGARVLFDSRAIPNEILDVLVVNTEVLNNRPRQIAALLAAWFAALERIKADPSGTAAVMAQREQLTADEFLQAMTGLHIPGRAENLALLEQPGSVATQAIPNLVRIMAQHGLLPGPVSPDHLIDPAPLRAVAP